MKRSLLIGGLALIITFCLTESALPTSTIQVTARLRPKIAVAYEPGGDHGRLFVKSNTSWVMVTEEELDSGARVKRLLEGGKTGSSGQRIRLMGRLTRYTAFVDEPRN